MKIHEITGSGNNSLLTSFDNSPGNNCLILRDVLNKLLYLFEESPKDLFIKEEPSKDDCSNTKVNKIKPIQSILIPKTELKSENQEINGKKVKSRVRSSYDDILFLC